jgi:dTMP kinase
MTGSEQSTGRLIVFEGIDGAGKSTQARLLAETLESAGLAVLQTREPTDGPHGRRLRESAASGRLPPSEELELFVRDRKQHVRDEILPALEAGKVVIVDRYYLSTAAYQGARGLDPEAIMSANEAFAPIPALAILLTADAGEGRGRIRGRGDGDGNLFERESELRKVAAVFEALDRPYIERIDGRGSIAEVHDRIVRCVADRLGLELSG